MEIQIGHVFSIGHWTENYTLGKQTVTVILINLYIVQNHNLRNTTKIKEMERISEVILDEILIEVLCKVSRQCIPDLLNFKPTCNDSCAPGKAKVVYECANLYG